MSLFLKIQPLKRMQIKHIKINKEYVNDKVLIQFILRPLHSVLSNMLNTI